LHLAEAESLLIDAIAFYDQRLLDQPKDDQTLISLANELHALGYLRAFFGIPGLAEVPLMRCVDIEQRLVRQNSDNTERIQSLAHRMNTLGIYLRQTRRAGEAERLHRRALNLIDELAARIPETTSADAQSRERTRSLTHLSYALELQLALEESATIIRQVIEIRQSSFKGDLGMSHTEGIELALSLLQLAGVFEKQSRLELASTEYQSAIELLDSLQSTFPQFTSYQHHYINAMRRWGNLAMRQNQPGVARQRYLAMSECMPSSPQAKTVLASHLCNCPLLDLRDPIRAANLARAATEETPADGKSWVALGAALLRQGMAAESIPVLEKASQLLHPTGDNSAAYFLAMALWEQGQKETALDKWHGIEASWDTQRPDMFDIQAIRTETATLLEIDP
jgi:tetratricopeptide (TPR) repeat protein